MKRMRDILKPQEMLAYREVTDRAPNWQWSGSMWHWGREAARSMRATHAVFLQDDLDLHPDFTTVLGAMAHAVHNRAIGLIANHPYCRRAVERGDAWYLTSECLGSGYVLPLVLLDLFLQWRSTLPEHRLRTTNEDYLLTCWLNMTGRRTWHPLPSPIDHRTDLASTNPKDGYPFRRSYVRWDANAVISRDLRDKETWTTAQPPLDFGFDSTGAHPELRLGVDPGRLPTYADGAILTEHKRIETAESTGARY